MSASQPDVKIAGEVAAAISSGVARTYIKGDLISVVLEDTLTQGERSLVEDGEIALVLTARRAYQGTMKTDLVALVETLTGRQVLAFLSDNHLEPDIAVESFILVPQDGHDGGGTAPAPVGDSIDQPTHARPACTAPYCACGGSPARRPCYCARVQTARAGHP